MRWNIFERFGRKEKFYLTRKGLEEIKKEYQVLKKLKRSKVQEESPRILHSDELAPEYLAFKEDLDLLDLRIARLKEVLKNVKLIEPPLKEEQDRIHLGATVVVTVGDQTDEFQIVGSLEADPDLGRISNECPVGKVLLDHKVGDEVKVQSGIETIYRIKKIKYEDLE